MGLGKTYSTDYLVDSNGNTGVAGQVLSTTSTGIDWADANTLPGAGLWLENGNDIYNSNSGNVGIGTTSPDATLEVYNISSTSDGDGSATETLSGQDSILLQAPTGADEETNGSITWRNGDRRRAMITSVSEDADGDFKGISFYTQGTDGAGDIFESMRIAHSGNVGIGATNPLRKLDLIADLSTDAVRIKNTNSNGGGLSVFAANGGGGTNRILTLGDSSENVKVAVIENGNVGIGTTSPDSLLEIIDTSNPEATSGSVIIEGRRDGSPNVLTLRAKDASAPADALPNGQGPVLRFQGFDGTDFENMGYIQVAADGQAVADGDAPSFMAFGTSSDGSSSPVERMRIVKSGNVGINNTGPVNGKLVVTSTEEGLLNTVRIQHTRSNSDFGSKALEVDMNLSGADTTTADRTSSGLFIDLDSSANGDASHEHRIKGVNSDVRFSGFSDSVQSGYFYAESNYTGAKTAQLIGVQGQASHDTNSTSGGVSNMYGVYGASSIQDLGDVDNAFGGYFSVTISTNRGAANVGVTKGVEGHIDIDKANTITYGEMMAVSGIIDNNEGTVPTFGNQYLFKGDYQGTKGGNAYGIYCEGDKHYFDGNVGIGITGPGNKLTVATAQGTNFSDAFLGLKATATTDTTGRTAISLATSTVNNYGVTLNGIRQGSTSGEPRFGIKMHNNSAGGLEALSIRSSGNVGIGTDSPDALLHVRAATNVTGTIEVQGGKATVTSAGEINSELNFGSNDGSATGGIGGSIKSVTENTNGAYVGMSFYTAKQGRDPVLEEAMRIDHNGNVGIGTTSPGALLQVGGTTDSNGSPGSFNVAGSYGVDSWARAYAVSNTNILPILRANNTALQDGGAYRVTGHIDGTGTDQSSRAVFWNQNGTWFCNVTGQSGASSNSISFLVDATTGLPSVKTYHANNYTVRVWHERINLNEGTGTDNSRHYFGADAYMTQIGNDISMFTTTYSGNNTTGKLGIGIVNASEKLHVVGNARVTGAYYDSNNSAGTSGQILSSTATGTDWVNGTDLPIDSRYVAITGDTMTGDLKINTSISFPLLLTGTNANYTAIGIRNTGSGNAGTYYDGINGDFAGSDYGFIGQNNSGYMEYNIGTSSPLPYHIFTGGNVGIGHTNPTGKLDIFRTSLTYAINRGNTLDRAGLVIKSSGNFDSKITFSSGASSVQYIQALNNAATVGRDIVINPYGGNVGINTSTPGQKLTVDGRVLIQNSSTPFYIKVDSTYKSWVHHIASDNKYILAPSTTAGGETWDWANQTSFSTSGVVTAKNFVLSSDKRNKTKIKDLTGDNVDISWKSFEMKGDQGEYRVGVIAQELEENHPEFVNTDDRGFKSVKYIDLLIAKIAELEARLEKLEK